MSKPARTTANLTDVQNKVRLAEADLKHEKFKTARRAAQHHGISPSTFSDRLRGIQSRIELRTKAHKLTEAEEDALVKWILDTDADGNTLKISDFGKKADIILAARGTTPCPTVSKNWPTELLKRRPELRSRYSNSIFVKRLKQEEPQRVRRWIDEVVKGAVTQYGIMEDDIYNFADLGFAMGPPDKFELATGFEYRNSAKVIDAGKREWVSIIECTSASGWVLQPFVILEGEEVLNSWRKKLPFGWDLDVSPNGWASHKLHLRWLNNTFIPSTTNRTKGDYRLLIFDNHGSHLSEEFYDTCSENKIIPLCISPESPHLLQPLDIGCFEVLKQAGISYASTVSEQNVESMDSFDFFKSYAIARRDAFKEENILESFAETGLVPLNSQRVFEKFGVPDMVVTPPETSEHMEPEWIPGTPQNEWEAQMQEEEINKALNKITDFPVSPLKLLISQVFKGFQQALHQVAILDEERARLSAELAKVEDDEKRERQESPQQTPTRKRGPVMNDPSLKNMIPGFMSNPQPNIRPTNSELKGAPKYTQTVRRGPRLCGICRAPGHRRETCQKRFS